MPCRRPRPARSSAIDCGLTNSRIMTGEGTQNMRNLLTMVFLACALMAQPAAAQTPIVLKLSHFLGPTSFFEVDFAQPWARKLEARTNGRVHVEIYNAATPMGEVGAQAA